MNIECRRICEKLTSDIADLTAQRANAVEHHEQRLLQYNVPALQRMIRAYGKGHTRDTKPEMIKWLVQAKLDDIDERIAELRKQIHEEKQA
jgi:hypothetical protein